MVMFQNKKAHLDPLCTGAFIAVLIVGALLFFDVIGTPKMLIAIFAFIAITSQIIHIAHHGINPLGGVVSFIILVIALFLLRYSFGAAGGFEKLLAGRLTFIVPAVVLLDGLKIVAS